MVWTEMIIILLVLLDFSLTIQESTQREDKYGDGENNPLNVVTGCILFVFLFEMSVRIYGYRLAILYRVLDLVSADAWDAASA